MTSQTFDQFIGKLERDPEFAESMAEYKPSRELARMLVTLRLGLGLSQTQFARNAGVSQAYISTLESGIGNPSIRALARLLRKSGFVLRLDVAELESPVPESESSLGTGAASTEPTVIRPLSASASRKRKSASA